MPALITSVDSVRSKGVREFNQNIIFSFVISFKIKSASVYLVLRQISIRGIAGGRPVPTAYSNAQPRVAVSIVLPGPNPLGDFGVIPDNHSQEHTSSHRHGCTHTFATPREKTLSPRTA